MITDNRRAREEWGDRVKERNKQREKMTEDRQVELESWTIVKDRQVELRERQLDRDEQQKGVNQNCGDGM